MMFLIKTAFWLTVVLFLLPTGGAKQNGQTSQIGTGDAVSAASAAVSDMRQFCVRQPEACAVGAQAASTLGQKAQAGAKLLYEFLSERFGSDRTGSIGEAHRSAVAPPSQNTLTPADLAPAWRGPHPAKEPKRSA